MFTAGKLGNNKYISKNNCVSRVHVVMYPINVDESVHQRAKDALDDSDIVTRIIAKRIASEPTSNGTKLILFDLWSSAGTWRKLPVPEANENHLTVSRLAEEKTNKNQLDSTQCPANNGVLLIEPSQERLPFYGNNNKFEFYLGAMRCVYRPGLKNDWETKWAEGVQWK